MKHAASLERTKEKEESLDARPRATLASILQSSKSFVLIDVAVVVTQTVGSLALGLTQVSLSLIFPTIQQRHQSSTSSPGRFSLTLEVEAPWERGCIVFSVVVFFQDNIEVDEKLRHFRSFARTSFSFTRSLIANFSTFMAVSCLAFIRFNFPPHCEINLHCTPSTVPKSNKRLCKLDFHW